MLEELLLERIAEHAPLALLAQGALRYLLDPEPIDRLFDELAQQQYTRQLLLSHLVDLMASVVCRVQPSLRQAYRHAGAVPASLTAVYDKCARLEPGLGQALVRHSAARGRDVLDRLATPPTGWLGCPEVRILDGNLLAGSEHRLEVLRGTRASALAGLSVAVLDPRRGLVVDLFPCENGHSQERLLLPQVLASVQPGQLWIGDRNYCTTGFLGGLLARGASFLVRRHAATVQVEELEPLRPAGRSSSGRVFEQRVRLRNVAAGPDGVAAEVRQVVLVLDLPTGDGEAELRLLTNLSAEQAPAAAVADCYRGRWQIEGLFWRLTAVLRGEVRPLGYPRAALFGFAVACLASNAWAVVTGAVQAAQPAVAVREELSHYQASLELVQSRGLLEVVSERWWAELVARPAAEFARWLLGVARGVEWGRYVKTKRGPKKPRPERPKCPRYRHVATQKLLDQQKQQTRSHSPP
jgi:hypothetical protein